MSMCTIISRSPVNAIEYLHFTVNLLLHIISLQGTCSFYLHSFFLLVKTTNRAFPEGKGSAFNIFSALPKKHIQAAPDISLPSGGKDPYFFP